MGRFSCLLVTNQIVSYYQIGIYKIESEMVTKMKNNIFAAFSAFFVLSYTIKMARAFGCSDACDYTGVLPFSWNGDMVEVDDHWTRNVDEPDVQPVAFEGECQPTKSSMYTWPEDFFPTWTSRDPNDGKLEFQYDSDSHPFDWTLYTSFKHYDEHQWEQLLAVFVNEDDAGTIYASHYILIHDDSDGQPYDMTKAQNRVEYVKGFCDHIGATATPVAQPTGYLFFYDAGEDGTLSLNQFTGDCNQSLKMCYTLTMTSPTIRQLLNTNNDENHTFRFDQNTQSLKINKDDIQYLNGAPYNGIITFDYCFGMACAPVTIGYHETPDCETGSVSAPTNQQVFTSVHPDGTAYEFDDEIHFWQRRFAIFPLTDTFTVNDAPVGCDFHLELTGNNVNLDLLSLHSSTANPPILVLNSWTNKDYQSYDPYSADLRIEAKLKNVVTGETSVSFDQYRFKLFIFPDCTNSINTSHILTNPLVQYGILEYKIGQTASNPPELEEDLPEISFAQAFDYDDICQLELELVSNFDGSTPNVFWYNEDASNPKINISASSNSQIATSEGCNLAEIGQKYCDITFELKVRSVLNGTIEVGATQASGTIRVYTECDYIRTLQSSPDALWYFDDPVLQQLIDDGETIALQYQVRDEKLLFDFPRFEPYLRSGEDVTATCGALIYTIAKSGALCDESKGCDDISLEQDNESDPGRASIYTIDQAYALHDCGVANPDHQAELYLQYEPPYLTEYKLTISVKFAEYMDLNDPDFKGLHGDSDVSLFFKEVSLAIRDYCVALELLLPYKPRFFDSAQLSQPNFEIFSDLSLENSGETEDSPWTYKLQKHLKSGYSSVLLEYMDYQMYSDQAVNPNPINQGCHSSLWNENNPLDYTMYDKSWELSWSSEFSDSLIDFRKDNQKFRVQGTESLFFANERYQIGNHVMKMKIQIDPNFIKISNVRYLKVYIEMLDCKVDSFLPGRQNFEDIDVEPGEFIQFNFNNYVQTPNCDLDVDYTLTVIEKPYKAKLDANFNIQNEGQTPYPNFVVLDLTQAVLNITGMEDLMGKTFDVYINGRLKVNKKIQGPMSALSEAFAVTVPVTELNENLPPKVRGLPRGIFEIYSDIDRVYVVGTPYDYQFDDFYVLEWGMQDDGVEAPDWIEFRNETVSLGVKFRMNPKYKNIDEVYSFYYILKDHNLYPMQQKFKFTVQVVDPNEDVEKYRQKQEVQSIADDQKETVLVVIEPIDRESTVFIRFGKTIRLIGNCTEWTSRNEGANMLSLEYRPSEEMETKIYDEDLQQEIDFWRIKDIGKEESKEEESSKDSETRRRRHLEQQNATNADDVGIIETQWIQVEISFRSPKMVSSIENAHDSMAVNIEPDMFAHESRYVFTSNANSTDLSTNEQNKLEAAFEIKPFFEDDNSAIKRASTVAKNILEAFFGTNILVSLLTAGLLQQIWAAINALQIIVLTALFDLAIPQDAFMVMELMLKMCAMDFFQSEEAFEEMFNFRDDSSVFGLRTNSKGEPFSKYQKAGYDSSVYFLLIGPIFFMAVGYAVFVLLKKLLQLAVRRCSENFLTRYLRKRTQYLVFITRFLLEGCNEIGLSAMITILMMDSSNFKHFWEAVSTIFAFLSLVALALAPIFFFRITKKYLVQIEEIKKIKLKKPLKKKEKKNAKSAEHESGSNKEQNEEEEEQSPYQNLFDIYRPNKSSLRYPSIFFLRRYAVLLGLTIFPFNTLMQIYLQMIATMSVIGFIASVSPFIEKNLNRQEIINEIMVLIAAYPLLVFTPWIWNEELIENTGWLLIAIIALNVLFNVLIIIVLAIKRTIRRIKLKCIQMQNRREYRKKIVAVRLQKKQMLEDEARRSQFITSLFSTPFEQQQRIPIEPIQKMNIRNIVRSYQDHFTEESANENQESKSVSLLVGAKLSKYPLARHQKISQKMTGLLKPIQEQEESNLESSSSQLRNKSSLVVDAAQYSSHQQSFVRDENGAVAAAAESKDDVFDSEHDLNERIANLLLQERYEEADRLMAVEEAKNKDINEQIKMTKATASRKGKKKFRGKSSKKQGKKKVKVATRQQ